MTVDTHVFRAANRIGMASGENILEVEKKLLKLMPCEYPFDTHYWLILRGYYVRKACKL